MAGDERNNEKKDEKEKSNDKGKKDGQRNKKPTKFVPTKDQAQRQTQAVLNGLTREQYTDITVVNGVVRKECRKRVPSESEKDFEERKKNKRWADELKEKQRQRVFYDRAAKNGKNFDETKHRRTEYYKPLDPCGLSRESLNLMDGYGIRRKLDVEKLKEKKVDMNIFKFWEQWDQKEEKERKRKEKENEKNRENTQGNDNEGGESIGNVGTAANTSTAGNAGCSDAEEQPTQQEQDDDYDDDFDAGAPSTSDFRGQRRRH
ncbi:unnamed protein product [Caenorhabditis angaria]|uniref:Uncharacterized protein n=1 Tax=Caenorhabditis angaria TaxID=860376 RepID=A0A9P1J6A7_9PELO|nr:unnamed protein product [Caenorhabditis angaria]